MKLPNPNRAISIIAIVLMLFISGICVASYAGLFSAPVDPPQQQISLPGLPDQTAAIQQQPTIAPASQSIQKLLPTFITIATLLAIGAVLITVVILSRRTKQRRDALRLADIQRLAAIFEKYHQQHGHYPVSATYDAQYYSAINILTEWSSYNFPPAEEMRQLDSGWPLSDPSLTITNPDQTGNYLYYPHHFGQRFSLYARLEVPLQHPVPDYNVIDKLPPTPAIYNYRFNSPNHHVDAHTQTAPSPVAEPHLEAHPVTSPPAATPPTSRTAQSTSSLASSNSSSLNNASIASKTS